MITNLKIALTCIYVGAAVAVPFALLLPKLQPRWLQRVTTARSLGFSTLGLVLCTAASIAYFAWGHPYIGGCFASFATLGLLVLSISVLRLLMGFETRAHDA